MAESEATPLYPSRGSQLCPFLPRYESTGSCCLRPGNAEIWNKRLNQSAPAVFSPDVCTGKREENRTSHRSVFLYRSAIRLSLIKPIRQARSNDDDV